MKNSQANLAVTPIGSCNIMELFVQNPFAWIVGMIAILSALGVVIGKKPVHSSLWFLLTLLSLASMYLQLSAPFISVMQVLIYAGAILVIFMFVIVLFQDAYLTISEYKAKSVKLLLFGSGTLFLAIVTALCMRLVALPDATTVVPIGYGSVESLGRALYIDFFFPFEAVALLFLVAIIGALYIGKKVA